MQIKSTDSQIKRGNQDRLKDDLLSVSELGDHTFLDNEDSQVKVSKQKAPRRKFSVSDKRKFLETYDGIDNIIKHRNHPSG